MILLAFVPTDNHANDGGLIAIGLLVFGALLWWLNH